MHMKVSHKESNLFCHNLIAIISSPLAIMSDSSRKCSLPSNRTNKEPPVASVSLGQEVKLLSLLFFKWLYPFGIFPSLSPPQTFAHIQEKKDDIQQKKH